MFILQIHSNFENRLFERIAKRITGDVYFEKNINSKIKEILERRYKLDKNLTDIDKLLILNRLTHVLLGPPRKLLFLPGSEESKGLLDKYLHSSMISLLGGYACYMHSQVFGRLAYSLGFKWRNFSMWNNGKNHNVAEIKINGKWIVFDPLFNQVFRDKKGNLVGKEEIHKHWDFYSKQIKNACLFEGDDYVYDLDYNYKSMDVKKSFIFYIKQTILFIWSKMLGYESVDDLKLYMDLNRYFYWQIYISTVFIFLNALILMIYVIYKRKEKNAKV